MKAALRTLAAVAVAVVLLAPAGCRARHATPRYRLLTPAPSCPVAGTGERLVDAAGGFELVMPANWRNLRPGDPGWAALYGDDGISGTEQSIIDGELQDFAVPLAPPDVDNLVTLAVYIDRVEIEDLAREGATYASMIEGFREGGIADSQDLITLPAGDAVRVTGRYPYGRGWDFEMLVVAYLLYHDGARYALVLVSRESNAAYYMPVAECMATSLVFTGPAPTAKPTAMPDAS